MDWITTSGRTLDEAKSNALDQLGIVADEAEFDVVNDVEKGLFGRVKTEAKIRARVRPRQPAPKDDRRSRNGGGRNRSRSRGKGGGQSQGGNRKNSNDNSDNGNAKSGNNNQNENRSKGGNGNSSKGGSRNDSGGGNNNRRGQQKNQRKSETATAAAAAGAGATAAKAKSSGKKETVEATVTREEQETVATGFLEGVLTTFGMTGTVAVVEEDADDGAIEMAVTGSELGLLVGQKGNTLSALQELTRTVVQRNAEGAKTDRLRVDVAGYRARRAEALSEFAQTVAQEVADSGNEKLLEPMGPADRKVVHDALTDFDGVETGSEGEEPRRRVVIRPV